MGQWLRPLAAVRMTSRFDPTVSFSRAQQVRRLVRSSVRPCDSRQMSASSASRLNLMTGE